jgi:hypothetical protein
MKWAEHVVHMGDKICTYKNFISLKKTQHLRDLGVNGRTILKWILNIKAAKM